jgi:hypothetical protein
VTSRRIELKTKTPETFRLRGFLIRVSQLANNDNVAGLQTFGALFDSELDLLAFLQVPETLALNGREMDKDIIAAFASEEAIALGPIEPLDCTVDTFRHFCLLMAIKKYGGYSLGVASETPTA